MKTLKLLGAALAAVTMTFTAQAEKTAKAVVKDGGKTLRFVYDDTNYDTKGTDWFAVADAEAIDPLHDNVPWYGKRSTVTKVVFDPSFAAYCPKQCGCWFKGFGVLAAVDGLTNLDTSAATSMACMFYGCSSLTSLDVSGFDTANVTNMRYMFYCCSSLTSLDVAGFDTAKVTSMVAMFAYCSTLTTLDVSGFDTAKVVEMDYMFSDCSSLTTLDLTGFGTANVTSMYGMFADCSLLTVLDVSGFDTANVTNMRYMFQGCSSLEAIYASDRFVTDRVSDSSSMFQNCSKLVGGNGTKFDSAKTDKTYARIDKAGQPGYFTPTAKVVVEDGGKTLRFVYDGKDYGAKGTDWFSVAEAEAIDPYNEDVPWYGKRSPVTKVVFDPSFAAYRPKQCCCWFCDFGVLAAVDGLKNLDTSVATSMAYMFCTCRALKSLDVSGFDTANVTDMHDMFFGCSSLEAICASDRFVTDQVSDSSSMFQSCSKLVGGAGTKYDSTKTDKTYARIDKAGQPGYFTRAPTAKAVVKDDGTTLLFVYDNLDIYGEKDVGWFSVAEVEAINPYSGHVLWYGKRLRVTKVVFDSSFAAYRPKQCARWFFNFGVLAAVDGLKNLDTSVATSMAYMFSHCRALKSLDVSGFDTAKVTDMKSMFYDCSSLTTLNLASFDTAKVTNMESMFSGCSSLEAICASDRFVTDQVSDSSGMFKNCSKLVGGAGTAYDSTKTDKTYARIDKAGQPGYFTPTAKAVVANDGETLRFVYDGKDYGTKGTNWFSVADAEDINPYDDYVPWYGKRSTVTKVVFDPSFAAYRPKQCGSWFYDFGVLAAVDGLKNLDTSVATNMAFMFSDCSSLTSLDVSGFDTAKVTDMTYMFYGCSSLEAICASGRFVTDQVSYSSSMFHSCSKLKGGAGTAYDSTKTDKTYARIDGGPSAPGYFTDIADVYKVKFVAGEGTGTMADLICARDKVYNLTKCAFKAPDGKTFAGWAGSNGKRYDDGVLVFNAAEEGETVTMTAIWK